MVHPGGGSEGDSGDPYERLRPLWAGAGNALVFGLLLTDRYADAKNHKIPTASDKIDFHSQFCMLRIKTAKIP